MDGVGVEKSKKSSVGRIAVVVGVAAVVVAGGWFLLRPKPPAPVLEPRSATVEVEDNEFIPQEITVKRGTKVTWYISGDDEDPYKLSANPEPFAELPGFGSKEFVGKQTYSFTFEKEGKYGYHNDLIPTGGGIVTVVP
jgi:plastocyanin